MKPWIGGSPYHVLSLRVSLLCGELLTLRLRRAEDSAALPH